MKVNPERFLHGLRHSVKNARYHNNLDRVGIKLGAVLSEGNCFVSPVFKACK
jgi:hypothetical protein